MNAYNNQSTRPKSILASALHQVLPLMLGYIPVGFAYGVLAQNPGISNINTLLMSLLVYAGSAQLIAVGLFAALANPLTIVATTFIVNLRHVLMSAALAPYLGTWSKSKLAFFSGQMTDETFALHATRFAKGELQAKEIFSINIIAHSTWVGSTALGLAASTLITDIRPIGLDFALPAMFIALLLGQIKSPLHLGVAIFAGIVSTGLFMLGWTQTHVLTATILAATLGLGGYLWTKKSSL